MLKAGVFLQNRYEIINRIGSGGMADVYKARDHKLNRYVAVKILKEEFKNDKAFVSKFRVEAQAAAGLAHSNIVNVYDVGEDRGTSFIVMELVEGITLKQYIAKKGRLSVREATSIALQAAAGLEAAHNNGIIHRDIKPQNIIISLDGKAKIADFGIARAASSNTITQGAMGSVQYSAPEQTRGGYSDAKSDIYSLGITFYEMLTGRVPFDGDSTVEIALKHLQEEIPSPRKFVPDIPFSTEQIVLKCTQKSPDRRYANMGELIRDLKESLVNPDGDFVVIPTVDRKAQTILLSKEEVREIKNGSLPTYNDNISTGAAGKLSSSGTLRDSSRQTEYTGSYYQNSSYQNMGGGSYSGQDGVYPGEEQAAGPYPGKKNEAYFHDAAGLDQDDSYPYDLDEDEEEDEYDDDPYVRRRHSGRRRSSAGEKAIILVAVIAAVLVVLMILFFVARALGIIGDRGSGGTPESKPAGTSVTEMAQVSVPDLLGKTEEEAQKILKDRKLGYRYAGESPSTEYKKGLIAGQDPEAGTSVDPNTMVQYYISSGVSEQVTMPDLTGNTQAEAQKALTSMGLSVSIDNSRYSDTVDAGRVITTNPGAGSTVNPDTPVVLYISQGSDSSLVTVPEMVNHYVEDAQTALNNLGLYSFITYAPSDTVAADIIISQDKEPGTRVQTGTTVTITVSTGPENAPADAALEPTGTWMCYAQLQAPEGYSGEPVRITLVQNDVTTTVFEGSTQFPYLLNVEGQPGVTTGTAYVYTLDPNTWEVASTTVYNGIEFSRTDEQ